MLVKFCGLTNKKIREVAYDFAEKNGLAYRFNKEKKMAGTEWLRPDLSLRAPTSTSVARAIRFNLLVHHLLVFKFKTLNRLLPHLKM